MDIIHIFIQYSYETPWTNKHTNKTLRLATLQEKSSTPNLKHINTTTAAFTNYDAKHAQKEILNRQAEHFNPGIRSIYKTPKIIKKTHDIYVIS